MAEFFLFAHRGARGYEPENTLSAFAKALELGASWIELDVFLVEGELLVFHDDRLERTTNGSGYLVDSSLDYLRSLDAGNGQQIPLLTEVTDLVDGRAGINVELKGPGTAASVASLLGRLLATAGWRPDQFLVSSFDHPELLAFARMMPEIRIGALTANIPLGYAEFSEQLNAWSIHASLEFINRAFVEDAHKRGKKIFVYTVNHAQEYSRLRTLGVDGVFSDFPDRFLSGNATDAE